MTGTISATKDGPGPVRSPGRAVRGRRSRLGTRRARIAWLFAAPYLLIFGIFYAGPLLAGVGMSFTDIRSTDLQDPLAVEPVGLHHYRVLLQDEVMAEAALNTLYFVVVALPLTLGCGLLAAVLLDSGITRFRAVFRVGFYTPVITSIVGIAVVWSFLLDPSAGPVNQLLGVVGVDGPHWLAEEAWAMPSIIGMTAWRNFGFDMVIFLAALQGVPRELHEAAEVDGAGWWARFRSITLPMLRPVLLFCSVYTTIGYLQFLEEPLVMTQGGPLNSTLSASYAIFNTFGGGDYGYASAAATALFLIIAGLSVLQFRLLRPRS